MFWSVPFLGGLIATCLWVTYRAVLPKPLPGILYNEGASKKLFGDVPEMMRYVLRTKRIFVSKTLSPSNLTDNKCEVLAHFSHESTP